MSINIKECPLLFNFLEVFYKDLQLNNNIVSVITYDTEDGLKLELKSSTNNCNYKWKVYRTVHFGDIVIEHNTNGHIIIIFLFSVIDFLANELKEVFDKLELTYNTKESKIFIDDYYSNLKIESKLNILIQWANDNNIPSSNLSRNKDILVAQKTLNLHNMNLKYIPKKIDVLQELEYLYISYNNLIELPMEIYNLNKLESLWIQGNKLSTIDNNINKLQKIQFIQAYDNNISYLGFSKLPKSLLSISLYYNNFTEVYMTSIEDKYNECINFYANNELDKLEHIEVIKENIELFFNTIKV